MVEPLVLISKNLDDTNAIASRIANSIEAGTILLLEGNLGSGKTAFVKALALELGIKETVTSPTFTLVDEYTSGRLALYHMDLYRLSGKEVRELHLEEYWRGVDFPLGVVAIEWAERLEVLPNTYLKLSFDRDSDRREIKITAKDEPHIKIASNLLNFCSDFRHRD